MTAPATRGQAESCAGTWEGDRPIREKDMDDLQFSCLSAAMADVTVFGRLEPVGR